MFEEAGEQLFLGFIGFVISYLFVVELFDFIKFRRIKFSMVNPPNENRQADGSKTLEAVNRPATLADIPIPLPPEPKVDKPKRVRLTLD
jgi:hypothetical protein